MLQWKLNIDNRVVTIDSMSIKNFAFTIDKNNRLVVYHIPTARLFVFSEFSTKTETKYSMCEVGGTEGIEFSTFDSMKWFIDDMTRKGEQ